MKIGRKVTNKISFMQHFDTKNIIFSSFCKLYMTKTA